MSVEEDKKAKNRIRAKIYYDNNREQCIARSKAYQAAHPEETKARRKAYQPILNEKKRTDPRYKETKKKYISERIKSDPVFKLGYIVRRRIGRTIKMHSQRKRASSFNLLGCTPQFLQEYLQAKFLPGMHWNNFGYHGWHIDHIIPLASASTIEEVEKLCHYTNLQPLWKEDNIKKSDKIIQYGST